MDDRWSIQMKRSNSCFKVSHYADFWILMGTAATYSHQINLEVVGARDFQEVRFLVTIALKRMAVKWSLVFLRKRGCGEQMGSCRAPVPNDINWDVPRACNGWPTCGEQHAPAGGGQWGEDGLWTWVRAAGTYVVSEKKNGTTKGRVDVTGCSALIVCSPFNYSLACGLVVPNYACHVETLGRSLSNAKNDEEVRHDVHVIALRHCANPLAKSPSKP
uniref:Uncharacterized protein n=1 Tax=Steinernema glaseri TaxID=37863 RepID=A0A1I7YLZ5_9BILA